MAKFFGATAAAALALVVWSAAADAAPAQRGETPIGSSWSATATSVRGQNGSRFLYECPAGGYLGTVWGSDLYTDDSSVCSAGVHAGTITLAAGGTLTIEIRPAEASYTGSTRNGVTTRPYGYWHGSFVIVGGRAGGGATTTTTKTTTTTVTTSTGAVASTWMATATSWRGQIGKLLTYRCPAGGAPRTVWGTGVYTDDSSVCTAAVHAGLISFSRGGTVRIRMQAARTSYTGSTRYGVTSRSYGRWHGSFVFVR